MHSRAVWRTLWPLDARRRQPCSDPGQSCGSGHVLPAKRKFIISHYINIYIYMRIMRHVFFLLMGKWGSCGCGHVLPATRKDHIYMHIYYAYNETNGIFLLMSILKYLSQFNIFFRVASSALAHLLSHNYFVYMHVYACHLSSSLHFCFSFSIL